MKPSRIEHVSPYRWFLMFFFCWGGGGVLKENNATNKVIKNNMNQFTQV